MNVSTVGVVIPVYRCAPYVRGCLESVLAQTQSPDEIVLVDDRGGDESIDVATAYLTERGRRFTLITQPRNGGLGRARNTGLAALDTDLVWFLDSDDQVEPTFVESLASALTSHDAAFAVTRTQRVTEDGEVLQIDEKPIGRRWISGDAYAHALLCGDAKGYACTKLFRREVLGSEPWAQDQAYEDMAASVRMALAAERVAVVDEPLYRYLYREGSLSTALTASTLDLFRVDIEVTQLISGIDGRATECDRDQWDRDLLGFRYREVLTSVAHVAMRAAHSSSARPEYHREAIRRVRRGISLSDIPTLWRGGYRREIVFAVLMTVAPRLYSEVLRWR